MTNIRLPVDTIGSIGNWPPHNRTKQNIEFEFVLNYLQKIEQYLNTIALNNKNDKILLCFEC
jgi:hypothetical protein